MAISGENIGKNALKMALISAPKYVLKIIRSIISHEAISGEKDGKMALNSASKNAPKMASKNVHKLNEV